MLKIINDNNRIEFDDGWDLYENYLLSGQHGNLFLFYFGEIYASGVYV